MLSALPTDPTFLDKIRYVNDRLLEWFTSVESIIEHCKARECSARHGSTVECACFDGDFALEEMVPCMEGHLFCIDCARWYAEERVFGVGNLGKDDKGGGCAKLKDGIGRSAKEGAMELKCMHGGGPNGGRFNAGFAPKDLERALPDKVPLAM